MDDIQLTPHFRFFELCATTHKDLAKKNLEEAKKMMGRMYQLAGFAERVREILGKPMIITSGYRCPALNKAVGGAIFSQHKYAEAIDFKAKGMTDEQVACKLAASDLKFHQLIIEHNGKSKWVHISIGSKREMLRYKDGRYAKLGQIS